MNRVTALRIFGSPDAVDDTELRRAYWVLRAHIEERRRASGGAEGNAEDLACRDELEQLDRALEAIAGSSERVVAFHPRGPRAAPFAIPRSWWLVLVLGLIAIAGLRVGLPTLVDELLRPAPELEASPPPPDPGRLLISSEPEGGVLRIEDSESGEIAYEGAAGGALQTLPAGRYKLRLEHEKCDGVWSREIDLEPGETREILARACQDTGWLVVRSNLSGDKLSIDGRAVGGTGAEEHSLSPGSHEIRVKKPGYVVWRASVTLPAAETVTLNAYLAARESPPRQTSRAEAAPPPVPVSRAAPRVPAATLASLAEANRELSQEDLSIAASWHRSAKQYLLGRYDYDRSGLIDTQEEVDSIPCADWLGLESTFDASGLALSMTKFFGFDGTKWIDESFGVSEEMRTATFLKLKACGVR